MTNPAVDARKLKQLRDEVRRLKNAQRPPKRNTTLHKAQEGAEVILNFAAFNLSYSRESCKLAGIGERQWAWSMGLLRYCGMAYRYGDGKHGVKPFDDKDEYEAAKRTLSACVDQLLRTGSDELEELRQHMPRKYRGQG